MRYIEVREDLFRGLLTYYMADKMRDMHKPHPLPKPLRGYYEDYLDEVEDMLDSTVKNGVRVASSPMDASNPEASVELSTSALSRALQAFIIISPLLVSSYYHGRNDALAVVGGVEYSHTVENAALGFLRQYNFDLISNLNNDLRENIRGVLWRGVHNGDSIEDIAARLRGLPLEPLEVVDQRTGEVVRRIPASVRADMIARTEVMRAYNQGLLTTYQQYGVQLFNVILGDAPCDDCVVLPEGNPYRIDDLPPLPMHPNCQCTLEPAEEPDDYRDIDNFYNLVDGEFVPVTPYGGG